jgi:solute carrier family 25 (mitochondrial folate transporter), member 32
MALKRDFAEKSGWKTALAGLLANFSTLIFHPLENVKLRLQSNDGMRNNHLPHYQGLADTIKRMYKTEGSVAFFRGVYVNMLGNWTASYIFFYVYAKEKKRLNYRRDTASFWLTAYISMKAGIVGITLTNPIWTVKTRLGLHWNSNNLHSNGFELTRNIVRDMYFREGVSSFYRGYMAGWFLSLYGVVQMTWYEHLSNYAGLHENNKTYSRMFPFFIGGVSRWIASIMFHPLTLVKTRQQKQRFTVEEIQKFSKDCGSPQVKHNKFDKMQSNNGDVFYVTIVDSVKQIYKNEGFKGFYKGLSPNLIRIFPASGVFFLIYDSTLKFLEDF